jgi:hypothetical protein
VNGLCAHSLPSRETGQIGNEIRVVVYHVAALSASSVYTGSNPLGRVVAISLIGASGRLLRVDYAPLFHSGLKWLSHWAESELWKGGRRFDRSAWRLRRALNPDANALSMRISTGNSACRPIRSTATGMEFGHFGGILTGSGVAVFADVAGQAEHYTMKSVSEPHRDLDDCFFVVLTISVSDRNFQASERLSRKCFVVRDVA